ncbi:TetR/AcrR family transcriptional regulator [Frondihabitans peucedani]|uniref:HTH tetR-type domain-containing protein n=1 Tax=Frondihabitans peucedani TaxID=598626 RepID=A0ABP8E0P8_9MICO
MDRSLDDVVLSTTLDLLADLTPDRVTLDEVASRTGRAKTTLYRRWATKTDLILAAVRSLGSPPEVERLPDRGSLRADLLAVVDSAWLGGPTRRLVLFAGLGAAARSVPGLREVVDAAVTEPYVDIYRRLLLRAIERGEVPERVASSVDVLAAVIPAMSSHRLESGGVTPGRDYYVAVVDDVVLAAVRGAAG